MKAKTFLTGLTVGIVGGAVAILMSTPQSGNTLRQNIARNSTNMKSNFLDVINETQSVKQSIVTLTNEAKNNIPVIINDLKETFINFKQEIEPETKHLKQEIENLQNSIAEIEKNLPQNSNNG